MVTCQEVHFILQSNKVVSFIFHTPFYHIIFIRDGFSMENFHAKCNFPGNLIVIQSKDGHLFGGYTSLSWAGTNAWKEDLTAFIFTLTPSLPQNILSINRKKEVQSIVMMIDSHLVTKISMEVPIRAMYHTPSFRIPTLIQLERETLPSLVKTSS